MNEHNAHPIASPDENAAGLLRGAVDPLRYDGHFVDPDEVSGIIVRMIPEGSRVLDVGCGAGSLSQIVADHCRADVVGIEPDPARAERAMRRGIQVHVGYFDRPLIAGLGLFDVVLFADVLEHLPNPYTLLLTAREALRQHGCVIVSVPNVAHWSVRACLLRGKFEYQPWGIMDATHLRWFTAESIKSLLAASGFVAAEYRATAGLVLCDNYGRAPLRWLSGGIRARMLRWGCRHWPALFGSQHVLKAKMQ